VKVTLRRNLAPLLPQLYDPSHVEQSHGKTSGLESLMIEGLRHLPEYLDAAVQRRLAEAVLELLNAAPPYRARMPRSGRPMSVWMSNAGPLGWYSDAEGGYRYIDRHPETGQPWPTIPPEVLAIWNNVAGTPLPPECCLVNLYQAEAKMGLHQDRDEADFSQPVLSVSLGDTAIFRIGGTTRGGSTQSLRLHSGDVVLLSGQARLAFHGIDRVLAGSSRLFAGLPPPLDAGGRINLTLRRVT